MSFKNQSVFSSVYTDSIFTITEDMQLSEVVIELISGTATLRGGLQVPGLTLGPVALTVGQPVVLNSDSGYTLIDIQIDSTAGGVFEVYGTYQYNDGVDASAAAYFTATGITGATQQAAIDNLVKSLKGYGLWSKMKAIYPFVTDNYNLLSYTEDFSNAYWSKVNSSIVSNTVIAPNGTLSADNLIENNTFSLKYLVNSAILPTTAGTNYVASIYAKSTNRYLQITFNSAAFSGTQFANFDLINGVLGSYSGGTPMITPIGNGWYRCSFRSQAANTTTSNNQALFVIQNSSTASKSQAYTGDGTSSISFWGAQLEPELTPTTYQPILTTQQSYISAQFKYNLKDPRDLDAAYRLVFNGGWTFSTTGALPNGTNAYADTKLVPSSVLAQNNSHISHYSRTNSQSNKPSIHSFSNVGGSKGEFAIYPYYTGNVAYSSISGDTASSITTSLNSLNYYIANRISAISDSLFTGLIKASRTIASISPSTSPIFIAAQSFNGAPSPGFYDIRQSAFATIGDGLTDTEANNLYIAVQTYQEALSRQVGLPVVSDPNAQAFIDAAQITDVTQADAINNLVLGLKYDNLWNKMTAIYPFVGGTATTHKYNLKDPRDLDAAYRLVFNGGWTHSSTGATPNGANGYADTFFTQTSMGMFANSHISYYARTVASTTGTKVEMGVGTGLANSYSNLAVGFSGVISINAGSRTLGFSVVDARGYVLNSATSTSLKLYKNGSLLGTDSTTQLSSPSAFSLIIGAQSNGASRGNYTDREAAFASIGSGLTDADASNLYNRVQTYQTALSRQVS